MATENQADQEIEEYYAGVTREFRERGLNDVGIAVQIINHMASLAQDKGIMVIDMETHMVAVANGRSIFNSWELVLSRMIENVRNVK